MDSNTPPDSSSDLSGFAVAFGFLLLTLICLAAPETYFGLARESEGALVFYIFATLFMLISVAGFLTELANREIASFLKSLLTGNLPNGIWGTPRSETWFNLGAAVACLIPSFLVHMIGIELLDATGIAALVIRVLILLLLIPTVIMLTGFVDELVIQPFLITPAKRLASGDYDKGGTGEQVTAEPDAQSADTRTNFTTLVRRLVAGFFALGQGLGSLYAIVDLVQSFLAIVS